MSGVRMITVTADEAEMRLDRWFKRHFPSLTHIRLEKLLRTGQVRVEGGRVKAAHRLEAGVSIRVPPLDEWAENPDMPRLPVAPKEPKPADVDAMRALVLYRDAEVIAINKPPGLAVQGGTNTHKHVDGMLDALKFDAEDRPRLVHRLDKDTSGVLLLARTAKAATWLAEAFREKTARKTYWALVVGVPKPRRGRIDLAISKSDDGGYEQMKADAEDGQRARTFYTVVENAGQKAAWLALLPVTGRTHQLRVHCATALGTPILGDGKYGGAEANMAGVENNRKMHLHARSITIRRPNGKPLTVTAALPPHMLETWAFFDFSADTEGDLFAELDLD